MSSESPKPKDPIPTKSSAEDRMNDISKVRLNVFRLNVKEHPKERKFSADMKEDQD